MEDYKNNLNFCPFCGEWEIDIIQVAEGYAAERINKAKGDVARFNSVYEEYRKAPQVTRERLYLETMEELFNSQEGDKKPTLIDGELENFLPLKNLGQ